MENRFHINLKYCLGRRPARPERNIGGTTRFHLQCGYAFTGPKHASTVPGAAPTLPTTRAERRKHSMNGIHVGIGDYAVASGEGTLTTVLGSCVGVILHDKVKRIGGLAHVYLPDSPRAGRREPVEEGHLLGRSLKYADLLVPRLWDEMLALGAEAGRVFGYVVGGAMLGDLPADSPLNVGLKNLERVRALLRERRLGFVEMKVGGKSGQKVTFDVATGDMQVREFPESLLTEP